VTQYNYIHSFLARTTLRQM